ncbi:hypothetical protein XELAEV_18018363mg [Xenopus laevis]|uniref:Uncharacterized protein n=1 Tax=Xenopus laevis TaxID=8355 RepID=A0A974DD17_XENLA|nr:hypothetical protein XELAEV_18018363mg [Xenopus laevis]
MIISSLASKNNPLTCLKHESVFNSVIVCLCQPIAGHCFDLHCAFPTLHQPRAHKLYPNPHTLAFKLIEARCTMMPCLHLPCVPVNLAKGWAGSICPGPLLTRVMPGNGIC